ncbi:MAG: hypothetical protein FI718_00770 [SAR202 cluster bacterium]|nr:hypothetical protein [Chloroflexota bacterium]MQG38512.1 hypothetical protein [SAR202 cluster bacterium]
MLEIDELLVGIELSDMKANMSDISDESHLHIVNKTRSFVVDSITNNYIIRDNVDFPIYRK